MFHWKPKAHQEFQTIVVALLELEKSILPLVGLQTSKGKKISLKNL